MPRPFINESGTWRNPKQIWINEAGTWRHGKELWVRRNGVWRQIFKRAIQLLIDAATSDYDLFTAAGSPSAALDIVLTVGLDIDVGASTPANAAIYCSTPLPTGSTLKIINKGTIIGAGGKGGAGWYGIFEDGEDGGHALSITCPATINNAVGYVFGGGGGGGGGHAWASEQFGSSKVPAWGGGGGAGSVAGIGGTLVHVNGSSGSVYYVTALSGTRTTGGSGWQRGNSYSRAVSGTKGGGLGAAGSNTPNDYPITQTMTAFGAAGKAVDLNGHALTWAGGENTTQIKGAYT